MNPGSETPAVSHSGPLVVLGVAGGIAAYKACEVVRRLRDHGCQVSVVPTANALKFVGAPTWEALSGRPVTSSVFDLVPQVNHVALGREADLVMVVPATADLLARAAGGRADDLLTSVLLTAGCPVMMAPAMHTQMWQHPATQANVATLRQRGTVVVNPASGRLTGVDSGPGRLPEPTELVELGLLLLADAQVAGAAARQDMAGLRVVVSAGGTREALDPVRFLGNASSGKMGVALARTAALRGADVTLVHAHLDVAPPSDVTLTPVSSTEQLGTAMAAAARGADAVVMAAAVADFAPAETSPTKIKKQGPAGLSIQLRQTSDVLAALSSAREPGQVIVGFAAETASDDVELLNLGQTKLRRKGADLLVVNNVAGGQVFGSDDNQVHILGVNGSVQEVAGSKHLVASRIWDMVLAVRAAQHGRTQPPSMANEESRKDES